MKRRRIHLHPNKHHLLLFNLNVFATFQDMFSYNKVLIELIKTMNQISFFFLFFSFFLQNFLVPLSLKIKRKKINNLQIFLSSYLIASSFVFKKKMK